MTTLYLTSSNTDKINATKALLNTKLGNHLFTQIESINSDSGIEGGQPYGLDETQQGCLTRIKNVNTKLKNIVSIENGFVKYNSNLWYDIAYIHVKIGDKTYQIWTSKRYFPKELYNKTEELIDYFNKNSITRYEQLNYGILKIKEMIINDN